MPAETKKASMLLNKMGAKLAKAIDAHANDEVKTGGIDLPGGIYNGVAQISKMWLGVYDAGPNKGQVYFMAQAVVHEPAEYAGALTHWGPEPICDTPLKKGAVAWKNQRLTLDDHMGWISNLFHMFGVDTSDYDPSKPGDSIEGWMDQVVERTPFVKFSTKDRKPDKNGLIGRPYHNWNGEADYTPAEEEDAVEDSTSGNGATKPKPSTNGKTAAKATTKPRTRPRDEEETGEIEGDTPDGAVDETEADNDSDEVDLDTLAELADSKDPDQEEEAQAAQEKLAELGKEVGFTLKQIKGADDWAAVARMIRKASKNKAVDPDEEEEEAEVEEEEAEEEEGTYTIGQVFDYKPVTVKDGKRFRAKSPVNCEILSVNKTKETVTLKNLVTNKTILDEKGKPAQVKFSDLEPS